MEASQAWHPGPPPCWLVIHAMECMAHAPSSFAAGIGSFPNYTQDPLTFSTPELSTLVLMLSGRKHHTS